MIARFTHLSLLTVVAMAQQGGFTLTGNMMKARVGHTATLLPGGKVLIAGGSTSVAPQSFLSSAELYDPATGVFTRTGEMTTARSGHSATMLPNGKVLIAGGSIADSTTNFQISLGTAELYDPSTGTFTPTGNMLTAGASPAVLLADGRVLIAHDRIGQPAPAELYDPVTGTFSRAGDQLAMFAGDQQATLLPDGSVLLALCCAAEQLYDPASGSFRLTGGTTRVYPDRFAAAPLMNGKVLLAGGYSEEGNAVTAGAELYDHSIGKFVPTGNMAMARSYHTATPMGDGTVLIAAGNQIFAFSTIARTSAELYDPATGSFSRTADMTTGRSKHTATLLLDGTVLIAGGAINSGTDYGILSSAELYHPPVPAPAPLLFSLSGDGKGQGAIWHVATGQIASADSPAAAGEALSMYTTNLVDGGLVPPQVAVGGKRAQILYFGRAPGFPGYNQVNFRAPTGLASASAVSVRLTYLGRSSNEVSIAVQ